MSGVLQHRTQKCGRFEDANRRMGRRQTFCCVPTPQRGRQEGVRGERLNGMGRCCATAVDVRSVVECEV